MSKKSKKRPQVEEIIKETIENELFLLQEAEDELSHLSEEELAELWGSDKLKDLAGKAGGYVKKGAQALGGAAQKAGQAVMNKIRGVPKPPPEPPIVAPVVAPIVPEPEQIPLPTLPDEPEPEPLPPQPPSPEDIDVPEPGDLSTPLSQPPEEETPTSSSPFPRGKIMAQCKDSSMVHSFEYNEGEQLLMVYFRGGQIYEYFFVPREIADGFKNACEIPGESAGKWFHKNVRGTFEFFKRA